ncbi:NUDIX hydrolase [Candidatus Kuenenbacteria bacterium]|nr:NUDIX hydrolase [Candidatus Kuenenbacteria bacterium]
MTFTGKKCVLAVDLLIVVDWERVLLIERRDWGEPGKLYLPGGHVDADNRTCKLLPPELRNPPDPSVRHAAVREGEEEVHLTLSVDDISAWCWLDRIGRDPRETEPNEDRRVSKCFVAFCTSEQVADCYADSDALESVLPYIDALTEENLGFDHWEAIEKLQKEQQRLKDFWSKQLYHNCARLKQANASQENMEPAIRIKWEGKQAIMIVVPVSRKSNFEAPIVSCPFCGQPCLPPLKD